MSEVKEKVQKPGTFKKGQSGNPAGPNTVLGEAAKLNKSTTTRLLNKFLFMDRSDLQEIMLNPKTPLVELIIGKVVEQAIKYGDQKRLDFLLTRLIGPVKQEEATMPPPTIIKLIGQDAALAIGHYQSQKEE